MTREEEIKKQAEKKALEPSRLMHPYAKQYKVMSAYEIGFIEGAVWADAHPLDETDTTERRQRMKRTTTDYTGIAACHNEKCPSHKNCLRWQIGQRDPQILAGQFAPKDKYSQRCAHWKRGKGGAL